MPTSPLNLSEELYGPLFDATVEPPAPRSPKARAARKPIPGAYSAGLFTGALLSIVVAAPAAFFWWLALHQLLWQELWVRFGREFPDGLFWKDSALAVALGVLVPYFGGRITAHTFLSRTLQTASGATTTGLLAGVSVAFCALACWQEWGGSPSTAHECFPLAWGLFGFWSSGCAVFWSGFEKDQSHGSLGFAEPHPRSRSFGQGVAAAISAIGQYVHAEKKRVGATAFGEATHPSEHDIETAGLV